jgi:hypothetical protein
LSAPIDVAYVGIVPQLKGFNEKLKSGVHEGVSRATPEFDNVSGAARKSAEKSAGHFRSALGGIGSSIKSLVTGPLLAIGAAVAVFEIGKKAIAAGREAQKLAAQTNAVIKSTGGAAGITAKQVDEYATKLSNASGVSREAIVNNENLLLTFTKIHNQVGKGNDIFDQATLAVSNMSVALKEDGKAASIQLGKALNDPIKGITALSRVGVSFTAQQKEAIKTDVAHGHSLAAQKIILAELGKEFGGSAAAQVTAGDKLKNSWHNMVTELGTKLIPVLDKLETWISAKVLPALMTAGEWIGAHWPAVAKVISQAWDNGIKPALTATVDFVRDKVIPAVQTAVAWVVAHWPEIKHAFVVAWANIKPVIDSFVVAVTTLWQTVLKPIVKWVHDHWPEISTALKVVAVLVIVSLKTMAVEFTLTFKVIGVAIRAAAAVISWLYRDVTLPIFHAITTLIRTAVSSWKTSIDGVGDAVHAIGHAFHVAYTDVTTWVGNIVTYVGKLPGKITTAIAGAGKKAWSWASDIGSKIINGIVAGFDAAKQAIMDWFTGLPKKILHWLNINSPPKWAVDAGGWIIKGFLKGAGASFGAFKKFFGSLAGKAVGWLRDKALGGVIGLGKDLGGALTIGGSLMEQIEKKYALSLFGAHGWAKDQMGALINLWQGESGWNPLAKNPSSGAYGIPQSLPASKMAAYGSDYLTNPMTQIKWGLDYIKAAYGNPVAAYSKWLSRSPHWYGTGLAPTLFTRPTLIGVGESGAETVSVTKGHPSGGGGYPTAREIGDAVAAALGRGNFVLQFDGDGLIRLINRKQWRIDAKGTRR